MHVFTRPSGMVFNTSAQSPTIISIIARLIVNPNQRDAREPRLPERARRGFARIQSFRVFAPCLCQVCSAYIEGILREIALGVCACGSCGPIVDPAALDRSRRFRGALYAWYRFRAAGDNCARGWNRTIVIRFRVGRLNHSATRAWNFRHTSTAWLQCSCG